MKIQIFWRRMSLADILEEKVLNIFDKLRCNIPSERIEAYRRISSSSTVTVKFTKTKRLSANF